MGRVCFLGLPVCCMSLLSEQEFRDQLVSRCPVHPGWRPTSTGQPKDNRNSKKWGWTLDDASTFLRIWWPKTRTDQFSKSYSDSHLHYIVKEVTRSHANVSIPQTIGVLPALPHLMAAFLSSSHIENKDSVKRSAGKQVQVADVIEKPR